MTAIPHSQIDSKAGRHGPYGQALGVAEIIAVNDTLVHRQQLAAKSVIQTTQEDHMKILNITVRGEERRGEERRGEERRGEERRGEERRGEERRGEEGRGGEERRGGEDIFIS